MIRVLIKVDSYDGNLCFYKDFIGIGKQSPKDQMKTFMKNSFTDGYMEIEDVLIPTSKVLLIEVVKNVQA